MDWNRAITINKDALTRIIAALLSIVMLGDGSMRPRLALPVYCQALRALRKIESAVRRLIVIAARGLVVEPGPYRRAPANVPKPSDHRKTWNRRSFQLFDPRRALVDVGESETRAAAVMAAYGPRIRIIGSASPHDVIFATTSGPKPSLVEPDASRLGHRLMLVKSALENLPGQARRLVRWQARRAAMKQPCFTSPLRPGPPPGRNKRGREEIDLVLKECHALAWDALTENIGSNTS